MELLALFLLLLLAARIGGEIAEWFKFPSVLGEIFGGIMVGPSVLGLIEPSANVTEFLQIGGILLLFLIGLSTRMDELNDRMTHSIVLDLAGIAGSFIATFGAAYFILNTDLRVATLIAAIFSATSTGVCIRTLIDVNKLNTKVGKMLLGMNVVDDFATIVVVAIAGSIFASESLSLGSLWQLILLIIGFITITVTVGSKIVPKIFDLAENMKVEESLLSFALIICFSISFLAEQIGVAVITGALLAGMIINKSPFIDPTITPKLNALSYGFFVPLFFANIGVMTAISLETIQWKTFIVLLLAIVGGKMLGVMEAGRRLNYSKHEAFVLGVGMIPRAEFALILSTVGVTQGIIDVNMFTMIVLVCIASIFITPGLLRIGLHGVGDDRYVAGYPRRAMRPGTMIMVRNAGISKRGSAAPPQAAHPSKPFGLNAAMPKR